MRLALNHAHSQLLPREARAARGEGHLTDLTRTSDRPVVAYQLYQRGPASNIGVDVVEFLGAVAAGVPPILQGVWGESMVFFLALLWLVLVSVARYRGLSYRQGSR